MFRAVEMFRWGGGVWLVAGLSLFVVGLTAGEPRAEWSSAVLGAVVVGGLACGTWWMRRRLARATVADTAQASAGQRALRVALVSAAPVILLVAYLPSPTAQTWLIGVAATASAVAQLTFAADAARLERRHGAQVLQRGSQSFFLAR